MSNNSKKAFELGQSIWYDNIQRRLLENGALAEMVEAGLIYGVTSNPSIFNKAIAKSEDYDDDLIPLARAGKSAEQIFETLAVEDIRAAADLFQDLYERTSGGDGYVSLEVNPKLANDTDQTCDEARRLWELVDRPNLMIKIPATQEGIPAVRRSIAAGLNVNVTLIFSQGRYQGVMEAYLAGLEDRVNQGKPVDRIASVASFFVSRIDTKVDSRLERVIAAEGPRAALAAGLRGRSAVANAKVAYQSFKRVFHSDRFAALKEKGARLQRPLWASTSTKNPNYSDVLYVDSLIGPDTVNTIPPDTLDAFNHHGNVALTLEDDLEQAETALADLENAGVSLDQVTEELEVEGVAAFSKAFEDLLETVEQRRQAVVS